MSMSTPESILNIIEDISDLPRGSHLDVSNLLDLLKYAIEKVEELIKADGTGKKKLVLDIFDLILIQYDVDKSAKKFIKNSLDTLIDTLVYAYNSNLFQLNAKSSCKCKQPSCWCW